MKKVPFKPRNIDEDIERERISEKIKRAAISIKGGSLSMKNIFIGGPSDAGVLAENTNSITLNNYVTWKMRRPLIIRGAKQANLKRLDFRR